MKKAISKLVAGLVLSSASLVYAIDSDVTPRPVPLTRPEMKQYLEDMKNRKLRIPLPELTDADRESLGERGMNYESRLRYHYMPTTEGPNRNAGGGGGGFFLAGSRETDSDNSLDYAFKTQLFWIVSRTNNCQYCLGHQESKLLGAGMTEDEIAALDGDWAGLKPSVQTAYAYARKITYEPHNLRDADFDELRKHYTDKQILEMTLSIAGNNAINRWKEGAGIPQSASGGNFGSRRPDGTPNPERTAPAAAAVHSYLTPTSEKFQSVITKVAPLSIDPKTGKAMNDTIFSRPPLEARDAVEKALAEARKRKSRLPLADEAKTRELLPEGFPDGPLPNWTMLLATFPNSAKARIANVRSADERGDLKPLLKAQVSWIIARQDRAWYAVGQAQQRLRKLGATDDQIYQLDGSWEKFSPAEQALFTLARKLAATPVVLTDADVEKAIKLVGPRDVVQLISYTTNRVSFDRITEAAGLRVEN